jgi:ferritin-like metal-binding protein YciE
MLVSYIRDAHAMEKNVHKMLGSLIKTTEDPQMKSEMEHHLTETERHISLLDGRLNEVGGGAETSAIKDMPAMMGAMFKGILDMARTDKPGKNARDAYVTEALEIAAYELLERLAMRCGDDQTAEVARTIRADEMAMRSKIEDNWDRVLDLTIAEKQPA